MTVNEYYRQWLQQLQLLYPAGEAAAVTAVIFENKLFLSRADVVKHPNRLLSPEQVAASNGLLHQLLLHKPVQYITGTTFFYGLALNVNEQVLIPRPETEELVKWVIDDHATVKENLSLLDIGTGSGCIPIALKKHLPAFNITALDMSAGALNIAAQNAAAHSTLVNFMELDFLDQESWSQLKTFDVIVSNPPYIPLKEKERLEKNVSAYEPGNALFVPDDNSLLFYEAINTFAATHLNGGGKIYVEIHEDLAKETAAVFEKNFDVVEIRKDVNGNNRMIRVTQLRKQKPM